jgi:thiol-disulfide isomerase/thioredoxin
MNKKTKAESNHQTIIYLAIATILTSCLIGCMPEVVEVAEESDAVDLSGRWRAALETPGGELPFFFDFEADAAFVINGEERIRCSSFEVEGRIVTIGMEHYDSYIRAELDETGTAMTGLWTRRAPEDGETKMAFSAEKGIEHRFPPLVIHDYDPVDTDIADSWSVQFAADPDGVLAQAIFWQDGTELSGTFLTRLGDYRYLAGSYENGLLQLSCFDGAHAFLFRAVVSADGIMRGDFWSRDSFHDDWVAERGVPELGDPYALTTISNAENIFRFNFPDLQRQLVNQDDFAGSPLLVQVMGTWCPNCNDEASLLVELYEKYQGEGLKIVSLANEFSADFEKNAALVEKFKAYHGVDWPILVVGSADKEAASKALSDLNQVLAFPTLVFIGRDGQVQKVHTGFVGPGTGERYGKQKKELMRDIEDLLRN